MYEFQVEAKDLKPILAKGAALFLDGQGIATMDDKQLTSEARRTKLQKLVEKIQNYGNMFNEDIRVLMNKKVVAECMRRLLSARSV